MWSESPDPEAAAVIEAMRGTATRLFDASALPSPAPASVIRTRWAHYEVTAIDHIDPARGET